MISDSMKKDIRIWILLVVLVAVFTAIEVIYEPYGWSKVWAWLLCGVCYGVGRIWDKFVNKE